MDLDAPHHVDDDGRLWSLGEVIIDWVGQAIHPKLATARAGVTLATVERWIRLASRVQQQLTLNPDKRLAPEDARLVQFAVDLERARAEGLARFQAIYAREARGGRVVTTVTEKVNRDGVVVERVTKQEEMAPDLRAIEWLLERSAPEVFGKAALEVTLGDRRDPLDAEDRAAAVLDAIDTVLAGREVVVAPENRGLQVVVWAENRGSEVVVEPENPPCLPVDESEERASPGGIVPPLGPLFGPPFDAVDDGRSSLGDGPA